MSTNDNSVLTDDEVDFLLEALPALQEDINELLSKNIDSLTRKNAQMNLDFISDAVYKLNALETKFTMNELKVMYMAAHEVRENISEAQKENLITSSESEIARSTLRVSNSVLRKIKKLFSAHGSEIESFLYPKN